jgi:hypothetical protein
MELALATVEADHFAAGVDGERFEHQAGAAPGERGVLQHHGFVGQEQQGRAAALEDPR